MVIRNGKIARLPLHIREQLNARLLDNEPGKQLVQWLNAQPEVNAVLEAQFQGRPISEQNLSEWRNGGYVAWQVLHDCLDHAQLASEGADHVAATGVSSEVLLSIITARLAELLNLWDVTFDLQSGPLVSQQYAPVAAFNQRKIALQGLLESALALRKSEQRDARLAIDRERVELLRQKQGKSASSMSSPTSSSPDSAESSRAAHAAPSNESANSNSSNSPSIANCDDSEHPPCANDDTSEDPRVAHAGSAIDPEFRPEETVPQDEPQTVPLASPEFTPPAQYASFTPNSKDRRSRFGLL